MRARSLKLLAGLLVLVIGVWGVSRIGRARPETGGTVASARPDPGQTLTITPNRAPGMVAPQPVTSPARRPPPPDPLSYDPWLSAAPPVQTTPRQPQSPSGRLSATPPARPYSGMRLPASAAATPRPASPVTITPQRPATPAAPLAATPPPARPAGRVTAVGPLGFQEEPSDQRAPLLIMENAENATMTITLTGPKSYRRQLAPGSIVQLEIEPGYYQAQVRSSALGSVPNRGAGEFRAFNRYYARWQAVPLGEKTPLRLGELAKERPAELPAASPTIEETPEEPLVKPVPETP